MKMEVNSLFLALNQSPIGWEDQNCSLQGWLVYRTWPGNSGT
jgi:hypothetical protein